MIRLVLAAGIFLAFCSSLHAQQQRVVLELVLAVDTSTSVDEREFELQRGGFAAAFEHPDLIGVIEGMGGAVIAVTLIEWAGTGSQKTIAAWTHVKDRQSAREFARIVRTTPRALSGMTDIGSALSTAIGEFETNRFEGSRRVIDVSGDGSSSVGGSAFQRDRAIAQGITINGLVIFNEDYDLGALAEIDLVRHYTNEVIGGNGAFLLTATGFEAFREAILKKLLREILGTGTADVTPAR